MSSPRSSKYVTHGEYLEALREKRIAKQRVTRRKKYADQAMHTFLNAGPEEREKALKAVTAAKKNLGDAEAELAAIVAAGNTGQEEADQTFPDASIVHDSGMSSVALPENVLCAEVHGSDNFGNPVLDIDIPEQEPTFLDAEISMLHATMHAASGNEPDDNPFSPIPPVAFSHTIFPGPAFQQGNAGFNETDPFAFLNNDFDVNGNESTHGPG